MGKMQGIHQLYIYSILFPNTVYANVESISLMTLKKENNQCFEEVFSTEKLC